jgi:hypothetical protein
MEMASCGYYVVCVSHNDGSADYTPQAEEYLSEVPLFHKQIRRKQLQVRTNELLTLIDEVQHPALLNRLFP